MIRLQEQSFDKTTKPGVNLRLHLHVSDDAGGKLRGEIYTDHPRIISELDRFSGSRLRLRFGIDVEGLAEGDLIAGSILLATDQGELSVPVRVLVTSAVREEEHGKIMSLSSFASLAERDPFSAQRFFESAAFASLLEGENARLRALYRGLRRTNGAGSILIMEEFLVGAGLKEAVRVRADFSDVELESVRESVEEVLTLRRSTWGSFLMEARTEADFIELPRTRITDQDFVGLTYKFPYRVLADRLGEGRRTGKIVLKTGSQELVFRITASRHARSRRIEAPKRDKKIAELARRTIDRLLGRMGDREYAEICLPLAQEILAFGDENGTRLRLYEAYLTLLAGRPAEAQVMLRELKEAGISRENEVLRTMYLALAVRAGVEKMDEETLGERTKAVFRRNSADIDALFLMFRTNADIARYPIRKLKMAESLFDKGSRSPFLYAEVLPDIRRDDAYVTHLSDFMTHVLLFAAREGLLTENLALRAAYLSGNEKTFSPNLFRTLTAAYEKWPIDGILEAIVRLLMKGQARDSRCFPWYERAVERNIRIIRLYEYYIETLPESRRGVLPLSIRRYFALGDTLSEAGKARVCANVVRNRQEDPETYAAYRDRAEAFSKESLLAGRISSDYAVLYQKFTGRVEDEWTADRLLDVVFTQRIYSDDPAMRNVVVIHDELKGEEKAPILRGTAYVHLYTKDAQILFEDALGRRYASVAMSGEPLIEREPFLEMCREKASGSAGLVLSECRRLLAVGEPTKDSFRVWSAAASSDAFTESFRETARREILLLLVDDPDLSPFSEATPEKTLREYAAADKSTLVDVLLEEGLLRRAYELLLHTGTEGISPDVLVRLASRMIDENGSAYDEELGLFAAQVFRSGKYDERILSYLVEHFRGGMEEMRELKSVAKTFFIETYPLDERMLERAVFTGMRLSDAAPVLKSYTGHSGTTKLVRNYLEIAADSSLLGGEAVSGIEANLIGELMERKEKVTLPMKLAAVRYFGTKDGLTVHEEVLADRILDECVRKGLRFRIFQQLPASFVRQYHLEDKVFIEQIAGENDTVILRYALTDGESAVSEDGGTREVWRSEPLARKYRGIFSKEFTLFYGEVLTYTITVIHDGEEKTSAVRSVTSPFVELSGQSAYERINAMLKLLDEGNEAETRAHLADFYQARGAVEALFELEEGN